MAERMSLKKDTYPFVKEGSTYWFADGCGIDCFHRLSLSERDLELLLEVGKLNMEAELPDTAMDMAVKCATVAEYLFKKFKSEFYNPFGLSSEIISADSEPYIIQYRFYDDNYCYCLEYHPGKCIVENSKNAWSIYCVKDFGSEDVEMDSVD